MTEVRRAHNLDVGKFAFVLDHWSCHSKAAELGPILFAHLALKDNRRKSELQVRGESVLRGKERGNRRNMFSCEYRGIVEVLCKVWEIAKANGCERRRRVSKKCISFCSPFFIRAASPSSARAKSNHENSCGQTSRKKVDRTAVKEGCFHQW